MQTTLRELRGFLRYTIRKTKRISVNKQPHSFGDIARRTALSFFLFATVLTVLLSLSWYLLVPELTRVEVGGSVRGMQELKEYKMNLDAQISTLKQQRSTFLRPVEHDIYQQVKLLQQERLGYQKLRRSINSAISELVPGKKNIVSISGFYYDGSQKQAELRGRVHNVGPRSMTVLAQFVEGLDRIPEIITIDASKYTREETADHEFYSPFTIRLRLQ